MANRTCLVCCCIAVLIFGFLIGIMINAYGDYHPEIEIDSIPIGTVWSGLQHVASTCSVICETKNFTTCTDVWIPVHDGRIERCYFKLEKK